MALCGSFQCFVCLFHFSFHYVHICTHTDSSDNSLKYRNIIRNITRRHSILCIWNLNMLSSTSTGIPFIYNVSFEETRILPSSYAFLRFCTHAHFPSLLIDLSLSLSHTFKMHFQFIFFPFANLSNAAQHILFDFQLCITMIPNYIWLERKRLVLKIHTGYKYST